MKKWLLLIFCFCLIAPAFAQNTGVKGTLTDTTDNKSLENSVVAVLNTDTIMVSFSRAGANGSFTIKLPDSTKKYLLLITHPSFGDYVDSISVNHGQVLDLKTIFMFSKAKLLEEVIVRGNRSMFMRGDTTVFTADSFRVSEGANVEELLKKLPGFQVDRTGQITAMGESVKKVLVDGEEFFGTDPGIATKNLRADVVQEVQVFDKKSDQSTFTGIDDGTRDKTINLKLKEDKKKGYFGKIDAGGGIMDDAQQTKDKARYYSAGMLNAFKGKRKIAAYGITSNTGFMNLDWEDNDRFGGGSNVEMTGDGIFINSGGWNTSTGLPVNYNGGFHYSNKFNQDKHSINAGYRYVQIDAPGNTRTFSQNFTTAAPWRMNATNNFVNNSKKHALNLTYEAKIDSFNTLKLTAGGNRNNSRNQSVYSAENIDDNSGNFINTSNRRSDNTSNQQAFNANLLWMHKFKKEFRTLSINTSFNTSESESDGLLYAKTDFYEGSVIDSTAIIDQQNLIDNNNNNISARLSYTEPIIKDFYMEMSYGLNYNRRNNIRNIYGPGSGGYNQRIDSLSNNYEFNDMANSPGMSFRFTRKKLNASAGATVGLTRYQQVNKTDGREDEFYFTNYFPRANISYQIKPSERLWFNYNGSTNAPGLEQMQPIRNNTDPLNQYIGNPNLRPSFGHSFRLNYSNWKMLNQRSVWLSIDGGFTQNAFTSLSYIRNAARTTQTVNANGVYNFNFYADYNRLIAKSMNLRLGISPRFNINNRVDFMSVNNEPVIKNNTQNTSYRFQLTLNSDKEKKYDIYMGPYISYNIANATVSTAANAKYWAAGGYFSGTIYLPKEFELQTTLNGEYRQPDSRFPTNNNFTLWDAEIRKWMLKRKLQAKIVAKDLLNERNGYSRNFNSSSFTETYNTVLRRHFLVGLVWNFNNMGAGDAKTN